MLIRCLSRRKALLFALLPLLILRPILSSWISVKSGEFFDLAIYGNDFRSVLFYFVVIFIVWIINYSLIFYWAKLLKAFLVSRFRLDVKKEMFHSVMNATANDFNTLEPGDYIAAFSNDITILETRCFKALLELFEYIITIMIVGGVFASIDGVLAGVVIGFGLLGSIVSILLSKYTQEKNAKFIHSFYSFTQGIKEMFSSFRTIKNYNITDQIEDRFETINTKAENRKYQADFAIEFVNGVSSAFSGFLMFAVLGIGIVRVLRGDFSMGIVISAYSFASDLSSPLQNCLHKINEIRSVGVLSEKINVYYERVQEKENMSRTRSPITGELIYENVSFLIDGNAIIQNFTFTFEQGKKYLLIGKNGAGKSTLFKLLKRMYTDYSGNIRIGNVNIHDISYETLSTVSSYLNEDVNLYSATVRDNIALFRKTDESMLEYAIKTAQVEVELDRKIMDSGSNISSGEKRRIEIARTLVRNTPIIIFDEVISTLDIETAYEIEQLALSLDSTVIFISHNFSGELVDSYDEILLLDKGKLIAHGTHKQLLEYSAAYRHIWAIKSGYSV